MLIFENPTAFTRGICIDITGVSVTGREAASVVHVGPPDSLDLLECGKCTVVSYTPENIELDVTADRACYLIFQDTFYPGWIARVDGVSREILRTDIGIRAVELSKGDHRVTMEFRPYSFSLGRFASLIGIALTSVYAFAAGVHGRRRRVGK
jgi:hypothetical protein